jgi:hypothetical protein
MCAQSFEMREHKASLLLVIESTELLMAKQIFFPLCSLAKANQPGGPPSYHSLCDASIDGSLVPDYLSSGYFAETIGRKILAAARHAQCSEKRNRAAIDVDDNALPAREKSLNQMELGKILLSCA